jgi:hypothetical protein
LRAFVVKHLVEEQGSLLANLKEIKRTPYSYTSKEPEASQAAAGNTVYVIEVRRDGPLRTYWLGYGYVAHEKFKQAGGGLWKERFKFKNSATPGAATRGIYFDSLPQIANVALCEWLLSQTLGMAELPIQYVGEIEAIVANASNGAKRFT